MERSNGSARSCLETEDTAEKHKIRGADIVEIEGLVGPVGIEPTTSRL